MAEQPLSAEELAALESLLAAASPAPWARVVSGGLWRIDSGEIALLEESTSAVRAADVDLVVALRNAAPRLLATVREMAAENRRLREDLREIHREVSVQKLTGAHILAIQQILSRSKVNLFAQEPPNAS